MQQIFDDSEVEEINSNYPLEQDDTFTPDQIEEINQYKEQIKKKIDKNDSVLRGLETFFWGITSYSLCRWLILSLGSQGISLAIALAFIANQIVNRDCLDAVNINRRDGQWEVSGMNKFLKFSFGVVASAFVVFASIGNFIGMVQDSHVAYDALSTTIREFNNYSDKQRDDFLKGLAVGGGAIALVVFVAKLSQK